MYYRPRLPNGKKAPLSWPLSLYRLSNNICWPVEDNASWIAYGFDRFCWFLAFAIFLITNEAEFRYLRLNFNNLDELLTGIPTYFVLIEIHLRAFTLGWDKNKLKRLLQKFYGEIYVEQSHHPQIYKYIQRQLIPILGFSFLYLCALISYLITPIIFLSTGSRELMYKMVPPMDYTPMHFYLLWLASNVWVGIIVATMMFGEANKLATMIFHLNGRYRLMKENLAAKVDQLLVEKENRDIAIRFRQILIETIDENVRLNTFAQEIQNEYSFRLFVIFAFMAASICALGFKVYTSPMTSIGYIFWAIGKVQETIAFGSMGTSIVTITDEISSMYYESKWEIVLHRSSDTKMNVNLMKLINLAIATNSKPFYLTGLNFFGISLTTAVAILQGAGSYFTCLISFR
ncbi:odorant receptor 74a-like [Haematobia irritans]|uniref:odorant receptor 74a-like n=1 Tax=Haematobia irritans TaxID=7368 RepID=UPI003F4F5A6F